MASQRITVRERLTPDITASLFANYRTAADALLELVDNAIDSRLPRKPLTVDVVLHPAYVQIVTTGGQGMGPREVEANYLRWGSSPKRSRNLLGRYGQGGKAAIGHLGQGFTIDASRPGDASAWQFQDTRYRDRSRLKVYELLEVDKRVAPELGYVRIRVEGVDKKVDHKRVVSRLQETYRPLLEHADVTITVNGAPLQPAPIPTAERHEFQASAGGGRLTGWYGVLAEGAPPAEPGLHCYRLGRLVASGEFFGHPGPLQAAGLARLVGEVEIPSAPLMMNKSDFDRDSEPWIEIEERMGRLLGPIIRRLSSEDAPPAPASAVRVAEQVRRRLEQALRMVDGEAPYAGFERAPRARDESSPQQEMVMPEGRQAGFARIVIRPLDPAVRSQTVEEEGVRVIAINSRHPLFVARRGDAWYQLETAAREVYATVEGASVPEYERRVDEVLRLALELRPRRRRRARARQPELRLV